MSEKIVIMVFVTIIFLILAALELWQALTQDDKHFVPLLLLLMSTNLLAIFIIHVKSIVLQALFNLVQVAAGIWAFFYVCSYDTNLFISSLLIVESILFLARSSCLCCSVTMRLLQKYSSARYVKKECLNLPNQLA